MISAVYGGSEGRARTHAHAGCGARWREGRTAGRVLPACFRMYVATPRDGGVRRVHAHAACFGEDTQSASHVLRDDV